MRGLLLRTALSAGILLAAASAYADGFSTSAINPSAVANGLVTGNFPAAEGETSYYLAVDLKAGALVTQMSFSGTPNRDKSLEFDLKDSKGRLLSYYTLMEGLGANDEAARVFPIDSSGRYLIVLKTKGPETTSFKLALGGSALPNQPAAAAEGPFSRSYLAPTALPTNGVIAGTAPGGDKVVTHYYFAADLKAGDLMSQISFKGRANAPKQLELAILDGNGRLNPNATYYIMEGLAANSEKTRTFKIDSTGRYIVRVSVSGVEGTQFKVELGGSAYQTN